MYDVYNANSIRSFYVNSLYYVRVKVDESDCFKIVSGVKQGYIMPHWLFNVFSRSMYMGTLMK